MLLPGESIFCIFGVSAFVTGIQYRYVLPIRSSFDKWLTKVIFSMVVKKNSFCMCPSIGGNKHSLVGHIMSVASHALPNIHLQSFVYHIHVMYTSNSLTHVIINHKCTFVNEIFHQESIYFVIYYRRLSQACNVCRDTSLSSHFCVTLSNI